MEAKVCLGWQLLVLMNCFVSVLLVWGLILILFPSILTNVSKNGIPSMFVYMVNLMVDGNVGWNPREVGFGLFAKGGSEVPIMTRIAKQK